MPATKTILSATQANSTAIFDAFKAHCNAPRIDTKNHVLKLIREAYPDHHVTEVEEGHAALFDFASADKAVSIIDSEDEAMLSAREWHSVGEGVEKKMHPGSLSDDYRFVRYVSPPFVQSIKYSFSIFVQISVYLGRQGVPRLLHSMARFMEKRR